jgi:deazaflavin-dependent oxidoreductase (nitroreductase family)
MGLHDRAIRTLGSTRAFAWLGARTLHRLDLLFADSRRTPTTVASGLPLCFLTVRGRRTGRPRTVPLLYLADAERIVLVATNWGRSRHPAWALNLEAAGEADVTVAAKTRSLSSRRASEEEVVRYWPRAVELWPGYEAYRRRVDREIRLFVLEPRDHERGGPERRRMDAPSPPPGGGGARPAA